MSNKSNPIQSNPIQSRRPQFSHETLIGTDETEIGTDETKIRTDHIDDNGDESTPTKKVFWVEMKFLCAISPKVIKSVP